MARLRCEINNTNAGSSKEPVQSDPSLARSYPVAALATLEVESIHWTSRLSTLECHTQYSGSQVARPTCTERNETGSPYSPRASDPKLYRVCLELAMTFVQQHARAIQDKLDLLLLASEAPVGVAPTSEQAVSRPGASLLEGAKRLQVVRQLKPTARKATFLAELLDAQWHLVGSVASQAYEIVLEALLKQAIPFDDEKTYWDETISSPAYLALYSLQTSPVRFWTSVSKAYREVTEQEQSRPPESKWKGLYRRAEHAIFSQRHIIQDRNLISPLTFLRDEVQEKQICLQRASSVNATSIGLLLATSFNGESFGYRSSSAAAILSKEGPSRQWSDEISISIDSIDKALSTTSEGDATGSHTRAKQDASSSESGFMSLQDDSASSEGAQDSASDLADQLRMLLRVKFPDHMNHLQEVLRTKGRPSLVTRYWAPATALVLSSGTILRIVINRKAAIQQWLREFGATTIDFLANWVLEPIKKVIATIRHDESSEVSIMSKRSLEGDRASLERMVLDFAADNPVSNESNPVDLESMRLRVREGDLTTILRAYEKDLQRPLYNSLRGNLVRTLLIQVQKTKVDVEVAMNGIDSILKSQELVFGFVGLTPGLLVCAGVFRWLRSIPTGRQSMRRGRNRFLSARVFRNIDRLLATKPRAGKDSLPFNMYGELVCQAVMLRDFAQRMMPKHVFRDFATDFDDLLDWRSGVARQERAASRIRWAYAQYLLT
ncbi:MAG: Nuclear control of ATPase protein 2 [Chrysothrix sp. TS-e1954]|nr:MAG: Nuclear control of ATPase protein 2 [Chrysothrix sp. TS-e1954]